MKITAKSYKFYGGQHIEEKKNTLIHVVAKFFHSISIFLIETKKNFKNIEKKTIFIRSFIKCRCDKNIVNHTTHNIAHTPHSTL